jgi:6-phosphogluconate dehydrogenase
MKAGLIGLGVMGRNLALNFRDAGHDVSVWDPWPQARNWQADGVDVCASLDALVAALPAPRVILLMVKAGEPVFDLAAQLDSLLDAGDIVIDGGNAHFADTEATFRMLHDRGIHFAGLGVSGGAEGARNGPSMMLGCSEPARDLLMPLLESIAARHDGKPCIAWFGKGGAGHFVKMVHNGIEYAVMEAIAEAWQLLAATGLEPGDAGQVFASWAEGELAGYLMEISGKVLQAKDAASGKAMIDIVDDAAGQKGTGGWTVQAAVELGVPVPSIMAALTARQVSSHPELRTRRHSIAHVTGLQQGALQDALKASIALALAQGAHLLMTASEQHGWHIELAEAARVWRQGSILRMGLLDDLANKDALMKAAHMNRDALAQAVTAAMQGSVPVPVFSAGLGYLDMCDAATLPTALVQLQRDRFGAHGLKRKDTGETFHGPWHGSDS